MAQGFPFCPSSLEDTSEPITAECFQRESLRDEFIVITFLLLTGSLVIYAAFLKDFIAKRKARKEAQYSQLPTENVG